MTGDVQVSFLTTPEIRDRIKEASKLCRTSMSRLLEIIILEYLNTGRKGGK